jgi:hypothetical protein
MNWRCGSSSREHQSKCESLSSNSSFTKKKKKRSSGIQEPIFAYYHGQTTLVSWGLVDRTSHCKEKIPRSWHLKPNYFGGVGHQWLTPIILVSHEAEIRGSMVRSQPQENSSQDPISKRPIIKKDWKSG